MGVSFSLAPVLCFSKSNLPCCVYFISSYSEEGGKNPWNVFEWSSVQRMDSDHAGRKQQGGLWDVE